MHRLTATFRIVTPMFIAGADQSKAELRAPSIKGVLRFWWRALAYARHAGDLASIRNQEQALFGSTDSVSRIRIQISGRPLASVISGKGMVHEGFARNIGRGNDRPGARYLGYGVVVGAGSNNKNTKTGELLRPCINDGSQFTVQFISRSEFPEHFVDAVKMMGIVGGLGSRSRRGFGSISLLEMKLTIGKETIDCDVPNNLEKYRETLLHLLSSISSMTCLPSYTAFSKKTRIDFLWSADDPLEVLDLIGRQMQRYRSWGRTEKGNLVNGELSEKNFEPDHRWKYGNMPSGFHPQRLMFGLPHSYGNWPNLKVIPSQSSRRASPLFLHVHQLGNQYVGIAIVIRSKFLADRKDDKGNHIEVKAGSALVPINEDWDVIDQFLDGKCSTGRSTGKDYFPNRKTWL